jgi:hypothetical protein
VAQRPGWGRLAGQQRWADAGEHGRRLVEQQRGSVAGRISVGPVERRQQPLGQRDLLRQIADATKGGAEPLRDVLGEPVGGLRGQQRSLFGGQAVERGERAADTTVDEPLVDARDELAFPHALPRSPRSRRQDRRPRGRRDPGPSADHAMSIEASTPGGTLQAASR